MTARILLPMRALLVCAALVLACDQAPAEPRAVPSAVTVTSPVVGMWSPMLSGTSVIFRADGSFEGGAIGTFTVDDTTKTVTVTAGAARAVFLYAYPGYCGVGTHGQVLPEHCLVLTDAVGNTGTYERL